MARVALLPRCRNQGADCRGLALEHRLCRGQNQKGSRTLYYAAQFLESPTSLRSWNGIHLISLHSPQRQSHSSSEHACLQETIVQYFLNSLTCENDGLLPYTLAGYNSVG